MRFIRKSVRWSHLAVLTWVAAWMLVAPLVHIHPEADHHHGEAGHSHGGIVHTVFSPDLDKEDDPQPANDGFGHFTSSDLAISDHSSHSLDDVEVEFSFLGNSSERKLFKPIFVPVFTAQPRANLEPASKFSVAQYRVFTPPVLFLTRDIPSRAPPPRFT